MSIWPVRLAVMIDRRSLQKTDASKVPESAYSLNVWENKPDNGNRAGEDQSLIFILHMGSGGGRGTLQLMERDEQSRDYDPKFTIKRIEIGRV